MFVYRENKRHFSEAMIHAVFHNDNERVIALIRDVEPRTVCDSFGSTLLHLSSIYGNNYLTEYFIKTGCNVDAQDHLGMTPLLVAVIYGRSVAARLLLKARANIHIADREGRTPLKSVVANETGVMLSLVWIFLRRIRKSNDDAGEVARLLIEAKWPLHYVVFLKDIDVTRAMIDGGSSVNVQDPQDGLTALHRAVVTGDRQHVDLLLEHGADVNARNHAGQVPMNNVFDVNQNPEILEQLLVYGTTLHERDHDGRMQSYYIFKYGNKRSVQLLLKYRADLTIVDAQGETAMHYVSTNTEDGVIELFSNERFETTTRNAFGKTPFHLAADCANTEFVELMLRRGVDVDSVDGSGRTPLLLAVRGRNRLQHRKKTVLTLVEHGADILYATAERESVIEAALDNRNYEALEPILRKLAKMEMLGATIGEHYLTMINRHETARNYFDKCRKQIREMKSIKVCELVSYWHILTDKFHKVVNYVRNPNLIVAFESSDYNERFSFYCDALKEKFDQAIEEQTLLRNSAETLSDTLKMFDADHYIIEKLVSYFTKEELRTLTNSS